MYPDVNLYMFSLLNAFNFIIVEILNITSTILVWMDSYAVGWSWWVTSWSAVVLIAIIALTCFCACLVAEERENTSYNHYCVCYYVLIDWMIIVNESYTLIYIIIYLKRMLKEIYVNMHYLTSETYFLRKIKRL